VATDAEVDLGAPWQLSAQVSLRDEPFGALAYHHGNRRLLFLRSHALVGLVRHLHDHNSATEALADLPEPDQSACARALTSLAASDIIRVR
jgi:putative mycofactocin binding protein MftB